jgi:hypothetical protein
VTKRRRKRKKLTAAEETAKVEAFLRTSKKSVTKLPPAYARGAHSGPTVKPRMRKRDKE